MEEQNIIIKENERRLAEQDKTILDQALRLENLERAMQNLRFEQR